jgi:hypothetical protein
MLQQGSYIIKSKLTNQCIDSDTSTGKQFDWQHPRVFMDWPNIHKQSHIWYLQRTGNDRFFITNGSGKALDSNIEVPQYNGSKSATPFMWELAQHASNHLWILEPTGESDTFFLISGANGKALSASGSMQIDPMHKTVFLSDINRRSDDMKWILQRVESGQYDPNINTQQPPTQYNQNYSSGGSYDYSSGGNYSGGGSNYSGGGSNYSGGGSNYSGGGSYSGGSY